MNLENLFIAEVVSNKDSKKEGRVKIFVEWIMRDWNKSHLPFARPISSGGSSNSFGISNIPEEGTKVWVFCEKPELKKNWYYLGTFEEAKVNPHTSFTDLVSSGTSYPNTKFMRFKNGITLAVDSSDSNPAIIIQHPKSTTLLIDKTGQVELKSQKKIKMTATQGFEYTGDTLIKGKLTVEKACKFEDKLDVDKEITAQFTSKKITVSKHVHIGNLGAPTVTPTPFT